MLDGYSLKAGDMPTDQRTLKSTSTTSRFAKNLGKLMNDKLPYSTVEKEMQR